MAGSSGTLGVTLAETIVPHAFTIDHISKSLALQYTSAPREGEVWGVLEGERNLDESFTVRTVSDLLTIETKKKHPYRGYTFVHLTNFTYDIHSLLPAQTFGVVENIVTQGISVRTVVFVFRNNWGNGAYTCIYRVRAHGSGTSTSCV